MAAKTDPAKDLERVRSELERVQAELTALDELRYPHDEWRERLHSWIDRQASEFGDRAAYLLTGPAAPFNGYAVTCDALTVPVQSGGEASLAAVDMAGLVCWLLGDEIRAKVDAIVDAATQQPCGPRSTERPAIQRSLKAELNRLEALEELAARALEDEGRAVIRRLDANPKIVLAWQDDLKTWSTEK